jgi:RimJ/RimL family protein N-acetyltransferase
MTSGKRVQLPPVPELTDGPDLVLRLPLPGDVDDIVAQCRDPEFQRWTTVPVPYRESDAQEFLTRVAEGWRANVATFAIAHDGRFAGSVDLRFDGIGGAEVGFGKWATGRRDGSPDGAGSGWRGRSVGCWNSAASGATSR